jgi:hypothetical protein
MHQAKRKEKIRNVLATTLVRMLLFLLAHEVKHIYWVHDLRIKEGRKWKKIAGMNDRDGDGSIIYLDDSLQTRPLFAGRILMHELLHLLFAFDDGQYDEIMAHRMERILWEVLTREQRMLFVKKLPSKRKRANNPE